MGFIDNERDIIREIVAEELDVTKEIIRITNLELSIDYYYDIEYLWALDGFDKIRKIRISAYDVTLKQTAGTPDCMKSDEEGVLDGVLTEEEFDRACEQAFNYTPQKTKKITVSPMMYEHLENKFANENNNIFEKIDEQIRPDRTQEFKKTFAIPEEQSITMGNIPGVGIGSELIIGNTKEKVKITGYDVERDPIVEIPRPNFNYEQQVREPFKYEGTIDEEELQSRPSGLIQEPETTCLDPEHSPFKDLMANTHEVFEKKQREKQKPDEPVILTIKKTFDDLKVIMDKRRKEIAKEHKKLMDFMVYGNHYETTKNEEENNMTKRRTVYDVIVIDKVEDEVVERKESIVAKDKTEALSKAGYYKILDENDHDTERFEAIITELYDYSPVERD